MGFGRIGRNLLRISLDNPNIQINTIADTADKENLAYLLKYDSIYGTLNKEIELNNEGFSIEGNQINFFSWEDSKDTEWKKENTDFVIQATGKPQSKSDCLKHIDSGAGKVILASTPTDFTEIPIYVPGAHNNRFSLDSDVISLGSNTSIAAGPVLDILDKKYGILNAYISTIHGYSNSNRLSDVAGEGFRRNRAAGENIIPKMTQSAKVIEHAIPSLSGKIASSSINVPVPDGSTLDLTIHFSKEVTVDVINSYLEKESEGILDGHIGITKDPIVSSDVVGTPYSGIIDSLATIGIGKDKIKLLIWFDNGWGYASQIIDLIERISGEGKNE
jgi:glyceraldehyde 3-phosphate dehydrogenase